MSRPKYLPVAGCESAKLCSESLESFEALSEHVCFVLLILTMCASHLGKLSPLPVVSKLSCVSLADDSDSVWHSHIDGSESAKL